MSFAQAERQALRKLLLEVGESAPTCCAGWNTKDLAVHLYLREHRPLAAAGMFASPLRGALAKATSQLQSRDYSWLVNEWGRGPATFYRPLDSTLNTVEHFVHHEDVRRAGDFSARELNEDDEHQLYEKLKTFAKLLSGSPSRVIMRPTGWDSYDVIDAGTKSGRETVAIAGPVGEMLLWILGRPVVGLDFFGDSSKIVRRAL